MTHLPRHAEPAEARHGFTILEMTLVIGILAILVTLTMVLSVNAIGRSALKTTENLIVQGIRRAQTLSQNNVGGAPHGMYIREGVGITIFSGATFTDRSAFYDQVFELNPNVAFAGALYLKMIETPPNPDGRGLVFRQLSGEPTPGNFSGAIIFTLDSEQRSVTVNGKGVVEH